MRKYKTGFVPANFDLIGKILIIIGFIAIFSTFISQQTSWFMIPNYLFYIGTTFVILGLYLIFFVAKK